MRYVVWMSPSVVEAEDPHGAAIVAAKSLLGGKFFFYAIDADGKGPYSATFKIGEVVEFEQTPKVKR